MKRIDEIQERAASMSATYYFMLALGRSSQLAVLVIVAFLDADNQAVVNKFELLRRVWYVMGEVSTFDLVFLDHSFVSLSTSYSGRILMVLSWQT
jgi:hypothetical protein